MPYWYLVADNGAVCVTWHAWPDWFKARPWITAWGRLPLCNDEEELA